MTRAEQESIVLGKLEEHLQALPDIKTRIAISFKSWLDNLITIGTEQTQQPAAAGEEEVSK